MKLIPTKPVVGTDVRVYFDSEQSHSNRAVRRRLGRTSARPASVDGSQSVTHSVVVAANEMSRNVGVELNLKGISTKNFVKNPIVLFNHDDGSGGMFGGASPSGGMPIAQAISIGMNDDGKLESEFQFLPNDEFAQRVENAWELGFIRGVSVRVLPTETKDLPNGSVRIEESDLLEWSIVSIPADPDTIAQAARSLNLPEGIFRVADTKEKESTIGDLLEEMIKEKVTEEDAREDIVARMAEAAGLSANDTEQIISGEKEPTTEILLHFAALLDIDPSELGVEGSLTSEEDDDGVEDDEDPEDGDAEGTEEDETRSADDTETVEATLMDDIPPGIRQALEDVRLSMHEEYSQLSARVIALEKELGLVDMEGDDADDQVDKELADLSQQMARLIEERN